MTPDPLKPTRKATRKAPDIALVPVELNEAMPHGFVGLGTNEAGEVIRIFARHPVEVEAFIDGEANLRLVRFAYPHPPDAPPIAAFLADLEALGKLADLQEGRA